MKYAKIETEKKMEMERKKHEIEELQRLKSYESAKAEANAVARLEEEEKNPDLKDLQEFQLNEDAKEELVCDYISSLPDLTSVSSQIPLPDSLIPTSTAQHPTSSSQRVKGIESSQIDQTLLEQSNSQKNAPSKQDLVTPPPVHTNNLGMPYSTPFEVPTIPYGPALMETQQRGIAEAIAEGMEAARLPTPHLTIFSGNPLDWPTWKVSSKLLLRRGA